MKYRSGFSNAAADKIWNDHLGNNAFTKHRDQCATCLEAYKTAVPGTASIKCADGERIFGEMLDEIYAQIDEVQRNQN